MISFYVLNEPAAKLVEGDAVDHALIQMNP